MIDAWDFSKKWFHAWEGATAQYLEHWVKSPLLLQPAGAALSAAMRTKALGDKVVAKAWGTLGIPTKRDQERTLHKLNQLESRLMDLEEQLVESREALARATAQQRQKPQASLPADDR